MTYGVHTVVISTKFAKCYNFKFHKGVLSFLIKTFSQSLTTPRLCNLQLCQHLFYVLCKYTSSNLLKSDIFHLKF